MLEIGAEAPAFSVQDHRGETVRLCDIDRSVGMAYGAADAAEAGYAKRISYVIGEDGRILHAYAKVDPKTHLDQVLSDLAAG